MPNRYDLLEQAENLMKPVVRRRQTAGGYGFDSLMKLVQTGRCGVHDYGRGFLVVEVYMSLHEGDFLATEVHICSVDDGGLEAWGRSYSLGQVEKAEDHLWKVIAFFSDLVSLPTLDELNESLRPLQLYLVAF